jgi:hypothetical protein
MSSVQTTTRSATEHAQHLLELVEAASQALNEASEQAQKFLDDMDPGELDLSRFHVAVTEELRFLKGDLTGENGSDFDLERSLKDARNLVALCELAEQA